MHKTMYDPFRMIGLLCKGPEIRRIPGHLVSHKFSLVKTCFNRFCPTTSSVGHGCGRITVLHGPVLDFTIINGSGGLVGEGWGDYLICSYLKLCISVNLINVNKFVLCEINNLKNLMPVFLLTISTIKVIIISCNIPYTKKEKKLH